MISDSVSSVLLRIGRTAALVAVLGGLLYVGVSWTARVPGAQWWMAAILSAPLALLVTWHVVTAIREGVMPAKWKAVRRIEQPGLFWFLVAFEGIGVTMLLALAGWSIIHIAGLYAQV